MTYGRGWGVNGINATFVKMRINKSFFATFSQQDSKGKIAKGQKSND